MHVCGGDEPVGCDDRLEANALAAVLGRGLVEHQHLAGDGILDSLSCLDHDLSPFATGWRHVATDGVERRRPHAGSLLPPREDLARRPRGGGQAALPRAIATASRREVAPMAWSR